MGPAAAEEGEGGEAREDGGKARGEEAGRLDEGGDGKVGFAEEVGRAPPPRHASGAPLL